MFYYLFEYINRAFNPPGFDIFRFLTFRSALAAITALLFSFILGPKIIGRLKEKQVDQPIRDEGPKTHKKKAGTPTMGGLIILFSVIVPVLLWADIKSVFILLVLFATIVLGIVGFLDDYLKVVKKLPTGLIARYKLLGQIFVGLVVGAAVYFLPEFSQYNTQTTLPFFKNLNWDFGVLFIPWVVFIITATSNAVNLTDGLDGLAIGTVLIVALLGAGLGFLWFNFYPAQVFMGDTGSLSLGGAFGVMMIVIKKDLLIPILGGIFFIETISVIVQRLYFKYTKKRNGEGKRIFKMAPIHHHFEQLGWDEPKIVIRFYIVTIILAIISLTSF